MISFPSLFYEDLNKRTKDLLHPKNDFRLQSPSIKIKTPLKKINGKAEIDIDSTKHDLIGKAKIDICNKLGKGKVEIYSNKKIKTEFIQDSIIENAEFKLKMDTDFDLLGRARYSHDIGSISVSLNKKGNGNLILSPDLVVKYQNFFIGGQLILHPLSRNLLADYLFKFAYINNNTEFNLSTNEKLNNFKTSIIHTLSPTTTIGTEATFKFDPCQNINTEVYLGFTHLWDKKFTIKNRMDLLGVMETIFLHKISKNTTLGVYSRNKLWNAKKQDNRLGFKFELTA